MVYTLYHESLAKEVVTMGYNPQGVRLNIQYVLYRILRLLGQDPVMEEVTMHMKSSEAVRVNEYFWRTILDRVGPLV